MREAVKAKVLATALAEKRQEIGKFIADKLQLSLRGVPQVNGYFTLPQDWSSKEISMQSLAGDVAAQFADRKSVV